MRAALRLSTAACTLNVPYPSDTEPRLHTSHERRNENTGWECIISLMRLILLHAVVSHSPRAGLKLPTYSLSRLLAPLLRTVFVLPIL